MRGRGWRHLTSRLAEGNRTLPVNLLLSSAVERAAGKEGITSESTAITQVVLEVRDMSLGGTSLSQEETVRSLWQEGKNKVCSKKIDKYCQ